MSGETFPRIAVICLPLLLDPAPDDIGREDEGLRQDAEE